MPQSGKDAYIAANSACHSRITAYNLFMKIALKNQNDLKTRVEEATGILLPDPWG
jgi:hypothetical protein